MKKSLIYLVLLTVILPILTLGITEYLVMQTMNKTAESCSCPEHSLEVLLSAETFKKSWLELELRLGTYLHSKDPNTLKNLSAVETKLDSILKKLKMITADNPSQHAKVVATIKLVSEQLNWIKKAVKTGQANLLFDKKFNAQKAKLKRLVDNFETVETRLLKSRSLETKAMQARLQRQFFLIFYIAIGILILMNFVIYSLFQKQKKAFEEKEKTNALNQAIITTAIDAIITFDKSGKILNFNPAAENILGFTRSEAIGRSITFFFNDAGDTSLNEFVEELISQKQMEITGIAKDGRQIALLASVSKIHYPDTEAFYTIILHDLSEFKEKENEVQQISNRLSMAADMARLSVWDWELKTDTFYFEKFISDDLNISKTAQHLFDLLRNQFYPDEIDKIKKLLHEAFAQKKHDIEIETHFIKEPGNIRYLKSRASIQYDKNGEPVMLEGITWDITELKRTAEIQETAKKAAEEANQAKSQFLANMSHEIRTPLNAIIGLNLLLRNTPLNIKQQDYVAKIHLSATSLLSIIEEILDFSKIEAGKLRIEHIKFNLDLVLNRLAKIIYLNAREKGLELIFQQDPQIPPTLVGDPLRISQILSNLISNAIKFTQNGQIFVSVKQINKNEDKVTLRFSVKDMGVGISEEQLVNLFQPFTQADISTTRRYGGTGLGLSICKQLVEMMHGKIWAQSTLGKGSTFFFELSFPYEATKDKEFYQPPVELRNLRILVVDDVPEVRETLQEQLEIFSKNTTSVGTAQEAVTELRNALLTGNKYYDLAILDWKLTNEDGLEIAKRIHQDAQIVIKPKIILISAYIDKEYLDKDKAYFDAFLTKPFTISVLFNTVLNVFGKEVQHEFSSYGMTNIYPKGFDKIRGAQILVAEDNELNQQVIKELLENEGFFVTVTNDGKEAVDFIFGQKKNFDLVLMDLHMPGMNGFEATKAIRQNKTFENLPVIALTADLASNVRQKIKEAGLNDFISKPIDPDELFEVVVRWIKPSNREIFQKQITSDERESAIRAILSSIPGLDYSDGLRRLNYNYGLYGELLIKFKQNNSDFAKRLKVLLKNGNMEEFYRMVHTLKSTAGNLGIKNIQSLAAQLESAANKLDMKQIQDLTQKAENELRKTLDRLQPFELQLKTYLQKEALPTLSREKLLKELQDSVPLLEDSDAKAKEKIERLIQSLKNAGIKEQADKLLGFVELYQFDEALTVVKEILSILNG